MIHHLRRLLQPPPDRSSKMGSWARWLGQTWAHLTYAMRIEPTWLEVNQLDITIRDLPDSFHSFRVVHLTDFHCGRGVTSAYLDEAVNLAQSQHGDLIVLTGDFIHAGHRHVARAARTLGRLLAPHGVWAVLGNHDYSVRNALGLRRYPHLHRAVAEALQQQGIRVLHNEAVLLERSGKHLYLAGVADLWSRVCDVHAALEPCPPSVPRIVLAHNPCTVEQLQGHRCDLMLSGHTHGGQVDLPRLGRVALGRMGRRYAAGLYRLGHTQLYVNKGVGFGLRVRYRVRPEIAVLKLVPGIP